MHLTDRLVAYLSYKSVTAYLFEKTCQLGKGYLGKQVKVKGSVGSEILEKVAFHYPDLDMNWLITGKGKMLMKPLSGKKEIPEGMLAKEEAAVYKIRKKLVGELKEQIRKLEQIKPAIGRAKRNSGR
jgi:hypothetical protein